MSEKIHSHHLARKAMLYVRQSSSFQVAHNQESQKLQYAMQNRLRDLGWTEIEVIDEDLGRSAAGTEARSGFERMVAEVCLGRVGAVAAREVSRFARNSRDWQQLVEVCRVVDTVLIDQETVYAPRASNDRLLLGLKGSLNEYELDLLRQRSLEARHAKAKRGELIIIAPVGYRKTEDQRLERIPIGGSRRRSAWCSISSRGSAQCAKRCCGSKNITYNCRRRRHAAQSDGNVPLTARCIRCSPTRCMAAPMPMGRARARRVMKMAERSRAIDGDPASSVWR
jgi:DNA invertase Pin-like site-specific DNA recombinase